MYLCIDVNYYSLSCLYNIPIISFLFSLCVPVSCVFGILYSLSSNWPSIYPMPFEFLEFQWLLVVALSIFVPWSTKPVVGFCLRFVASGVFWSFLNLSVFTTRSPHFCGFGIVSLLHPTSYLHIPPVPPTLPFTFHILSLVAFPALRLVFLYLQNFQ